jgi:hypothetical protein
MLTPEGVHHELFTGALASHTPLLMLMEIKSLLYTHQATPCPVKGSKRSNAACLCVFQKHTTFFGFDVITKGGAN